MGGVVRTELRMLCLCYVMSCHVIFGVSYLALSFDHPLLTRVLSDGTIANPRIVNEINAYIERCEGKSALNENETETPTDLQRTKSKSGVYTSLWAIHPLTQHRLPIYVVDYVLSTYGTGAVMGVPAHDTRDYEFALKHSLPIPTVVQPNMPTANDRENNKKMQQTQQQQQQQEPGHADYSRQAITKSYARCIACHSTYSVPFHLLTQQLFSQ